MKDIVIFFILTMIIQLGLPEQGRAAKKPTFRIKYFDLSNSGPPLQSDTLADTVSLQNAIVKSKCLEKQVTGFSKVRKDPEIARILKFAKGSPMSIELVVTAGPEVDDKGKPVPKMSELAIWREDPEKGHQLLNSDQIVGGTSSCKMNKRRLKGLLVPVVQMEKKRLDEMRSFQEAEKKRKERLKMHEAGKLLSEING